MPTWKRKDAAGTVHFQFLCSACNAQKAPFLEQDQWIQVRDGEPASCNDCVLGCALTTRTLWGAADEVRAAVCDECPTLDACTLKGRYFC